MATYIKEKYKTKEKIIDNIKEIEYIIIKLEEIKLIIIINIYIKPQINHKLFEEEIKRIIDYTKKEKNYKSIIGGDFNAHHQAWGNTKNKGKGKILNEIIEEKKLIIANSGEKTLINNKSDNISAIDLTIVSQGLYGKIKWWVEETIGSDHFTIITKISENNEGDK